MAQRVGVLGGTFDPVHFGHLFIAEEARLRLRLEEVVFVPAGRPYLRSGGEPSPAEHRLAMVRLAVAENPFFRVSTVEVDRPGPTYTVDTLEELRREMGPDVELFFVMGMDSLVDFHRWREPARILELCTVAVMVRPGYEGFERDSLAFISPRAMERIVFLDTPGIDISATEIRRRVAQGVSIRYWVPDAVEAYIRRVGLYRSQ